MTFHEPMGLAVLANRADNEQARRELRRRGLSCLGHALVRRFRNRGLLPGVNVGDPLKSWDVLRTLAFLEARLPHDAPVLDFGAYASEIPCVLYRAGFRSLAGIDLNPGVLRMPYARRIRYVVGDLLATPFPTQAFMAVTAVSVIEHGFDGERLLAEVSRLLAPGGVFLASTDYWAAKVATAGIEAFGMPWTIFSREELARFIDRAGGHDLFPVGPLQFECDERVVRWNDRSYTFAWLALEKGPRAVSPPRHTTVTSSAGPPDLAQDPR